MDSLQSWSVYNDFTSKNTALYNLFFFLLTTYLLIVSQIATLVFGFVRSQQSHKIIESKKEMKKEIRQSQLLTGTRDSETSLKTVTVVETDDDSVSSDSDNSTHGYFDPPINNYRQMHHLNNRKTGDFEGNQFII